MVDPGFAPIPRDEKYKVLVLIVVAFIVVAKMFVTLTAFETYTFPWT